MFSSICNMFGSPLSLLDGLVGYWKVDGNSYDEVGHTTGVDTNIVYGAGKIGQCAIAQPTGSNITTTVSGPGANSPFSVSAWSYTPSTLGFGAYGIAVWRPAVGDWVSFRAEPVGFGPPTPTFKYGVQFGALNACSTVSAYAADTWHHVLATFTGGAGGTVKIYVDGVLDKTYVCSGLNTATASIKLLAWAMADNIGGSADEIGVWSRCLGQGDAISLYNGGAGKTYPFP